MSTIPQYYGCFTLLYGDPEVREQQQYLQPLYGLTADDDPPVVRGRRESSLDASLSSANSSLASAEDTPGDDVANLQRVSIPGEPAVVRHKHPRISSGFTSASADVGNESDGAANQVREGDTTGQTRDSAQRESGTGSADEAANAAAALVAPRPPRKINRVDLSLFADLCTGVVGPQPVFGGVAVTSEPPSETVPNHAAAASPATSSPTPYLFNTSGAPLLSSVVEADALQRLQEARKPYPAPQPRSGHVLLPCTTRGTLILYGGLGDDPFNDVWEYHTTTGRWAKLNCTTAAPSTSSSPLSSMTGLEDEDDETALIADRGIAVAESATSAAADPSDAAAPSPGSPPQQQQGNAEQAPATDDLDTAGPGPTETLAAFIARLQAENRRTSDPSSLTYSEDDDDYDGSDVDNEGVRAFRRHHDDMPPPAYGQAASLYTDESGDTCMAVLGGITVGDVCVHGFFSLNLSTLVWRRVELTMPVKDVWGATAQTLYAPRRYARSAGSNVPSGNKGDNDENEQVVVLFGGMTATGEVIEPTTTILHLDHALTADEVEANADMFLDSMNYSKREHDRVMRHVLREEDAAAQERDGAPADDSQSISIEERCASWREAHADQLVQWRRRALRNLEGKYWTETLAPTNGLRGRRRPTSAALHRHFMYIFGGRDDMYFYNDLWCLNIVTRVWVQVRDGIPAALLRSFLAHPHNPTYGAVLSERAAQLRRRTVAAVEAKLLQTSTNGTFNPLVRARDIHHALYSSSVNSTARARTGACMVVDVRRECLYVYGGFSYTGQQHLTFFDLHAYYVQENVWRRVAICNGRVWDAALDGMQDAVNLVDPCEEARPYPRHARPERPMHGCHQHPPLHSPSSSSPSSSSLPLTLMGYATRYLRPQRSMTAFHTSVPAVCPPDSAPAPLIVRRGQRVVGTVAFDAQPRVNPTDHFHLPVFVPEARTMAAMAEDPLHPGNRFFLHGGRSGEEACGDFFELRTAVSRTVDVEYAKTQRAARQAAQEAAAAAATAAAASRVTTAPSPASARPSVSSAAGGASRVGSSPPSTFQPAATVPTASTAASASATPAGSQADTTRLQLRNRRQLQRQLISAALESQEILEDAPAAHAVALAQTTPLPHHSLRDKATLWIRDGLAALDPKSLMFVELRNGHAVVNLRTHIHYSSRLSLLAAANDEQQQQQQHSEESSANRHSGAACPTTPSLPASSAGISSYRSMYSSEWRSSSGTSPTHPHPPSSSSSPPSATPQQTDSFDGHLKRSALSLEILLYDVLLSKPICNNTNGGDGTLVTSPCTHSAVLSTSPENHTTFPSCPSVGSGSPGASPSANTPLLASAHVQIVSRAQYSTPRTPQTSSAFAGLSQQQQQGATAPAQTQQPPSFSPPQVEARSDARGQEHRTPSPALTRRNSSNGISYQQQPTNNEYDYHVLLRSLFHSEPFYKTFGASEKKR
jgi:hypothetical protein